MVYCGAGGKLIHEKNQKQKISWHCPFKWVGSVWELRLLYGKIFSDDVTAYSRPWTKPSNFAYSVYYLLHGTTRLKRTKSISGNS